MYNDELKEASIKFNKIESDFTGNMLLTDVDILFNNENQNAINISHHLTILTILRVLYEKGIVTHDELLDSENKTKSWIYDIIQQTDREVEDQLILDIGQNVTDTMKTVLTGDGDWISGLAQKCRDNYKINNLIW